VGVRKNFSLFPLRPRQARCCLFLMGSAIVDDRFSVHPSISVDIGRRQHFPSAAKVHHGGGNSTEYPKLFWGWLRSTSQLRGPFLISSVVEGFLLLGCHFIRQSRYKDGKHLFELFCLSGIDLADAVRCNSCPRRRFNHAECDGLALLNIRQLPLPAFLLGPGSMSDLKYVRGMLLTLATNQPPLGKNLPIDQNFESLHFSFSRARQCPGTSANPWMMAGPNGSALEDQNEVPKG
jgi:hypothetical protein